MNIKAKYTNWELLWQVRPIKMQGLAIITCVHWLKVDRVGRK
jgi:hypothetical protein